MSENLNWAPPILREADRLFDEIEAARILGISPRTLRKDRWARSIGIPHLKIGSRVLYSAGDLLAFLERSRRGGEEGGAA